MSIKVLLCGAGLIFVLVLGIFCMKTEEGLPIDRAIATFAFEQRTEARTQFMRFITFFGGVLFVTGFSLVLILLLLWKKEHVHALLILISSLGAGGMNNLLKWIFARPRPADSALIQEVFYSFPSGHSMVSMALYLTLAEILRRKWGTSRMLHVPFYLLIGLIGMSRIYLGVHWFSDVIGGYVGGFLVYYAGKELLLK